MNRHHHLYILTNPNQLTLACALSVRHQPVIEKDFKFSTDLKKKSQFHFTESIDESNLTQQQDVLVILTHKMDSLSVLTSKGFLTF